MADMGGLVGIDGGVFDDHLLIRCGWQRKSHVCPGAPIDTQVDEAGGGDVDRMYYMFEGVMFV